MRAHTLWLSPRYYPQHYTKIPKNIGRRLNFLHDQRRHSNEFRHIHMSSPTWEEKRTTTKNVLQYVTHAHATSEIHMFKRLAAAIGDNGALDAVRRHQLQRPANTPH